EAGFVGTEKGLGIEKEKHRHRTMGTMFAKLVLGPEPLVVILRWRPRPEVEPDMIFPACVGLADDLCTRNVRSHPSLVTANSLPSTKILRAFSMSVKWNR